MATSATKNGKVNIADMIVSVDKIEKTRRGRTAVVDPDLRDLLAAVKPGEAALTGALLGTVTDQTERSKVAQKIRSHWKMTHGDVPCSINWSPAGVAQVSFAKS